MDQNKQAFEPTPENIDAALTVVQREYFMNALAIVSMDESKKDFTYLQTSIIGDKGETYMVSIMHLSGPKIDLDAIRKAGIEVVDDPNKKSPA